MSCAVITPAAEPQGQCGLVIDIAELRVLDGHPVVPKEVLPVDEGEGLLRFVRAKNAVMLPEEGSERLIAGPAAAVHVADLLVGLGCVVLRGHQVVREVEVIRPFRLSHDHGLPAPVLVELHDGAVPSGIGHHVVIPASDLRVMAHVDSLQEGRYTGSPWMSEPLMVSMMLSSAVATVSFSSPVDWDTAFTISALVIVSEFYRFIFLYKISLAQNKYSENRGYKQLQSRFCVVDVGLIAKELFWISDTDFAELNEIRTLYVGIS